MMTEAEPNVFEAVLGAWGGRGWTSLNLHAAAEEMLRSVILKASTTVAPPSLVARYAALRAHS